MLRKVITNAAWTLFGVLAFAVCIDIFGGYPRWHTEALDWVAVAALMVAAAGVWLWSERSDDDG